VTRRSARVQRRPPPDLDGFPRADEPLPTIWYREHAARPEQPDLGCWWFSSHAAGAEPGGRFDLRSPHGTCYLGETRGVAVRERCGRFLAARLPVPASHLTGRVVSEVSPEPFPVAVADLTSPDGARFGVTGELAAGNDYGLSAAWADALATASFDALLFQPRFTPGQERGLALFGEAGADPRRGPVRSVEGVAEVLDRLGYRVLEVPSSQATAVDDEAEPEGE
jgi:hypothetical protein